MNYYELRMNCSLWYSYHYSWKTETAVGSLVHYFTTNTTTMCLSLTPYIPHTCANILLVWKQDGKMMTMFVTKVTNTSPHTHPLILAYSTPADCTSISTATLDKINVPNLCAYVRNLTDGEFASRPILRSLVSHPTYRSLSSEIPEMSLQVTHLTGLDGSHQFTLHSMLRPMNDFVQKSFGSLPSDASPDEWRMVAQAVNERLATDLVGYSHVDTTKTLDMFMSELYTAIQWAAAMTMTRRLYHLIIDTCGTDTVAILTELFGTEHCDESVFEHSKLKLPLASDICDTVKKICKIRDTLLDHVDCNHTIICTKPLAPNASAMGTMLFQTNPDQNVPMPGMCHEDGNRTTETNVILGKGLRLDLRSLKHGILEPTPTGTAWNIKDPGLFDCSQAQSTQQMSRENIQRECAKAGYNVEVCSARTISGGIALGSRVYDVPVSEAKWTEFTGCSSVTSDMD